MSSILPSLGLEVGAGAFGGFIVGFAIKKISKIVAVIIGLFVLGIIYLSTQNIIQVDFAALWRALNGAFGLAESGFTWLVGVISLLPFAATFVGGFLLGFKVG